MVSEFFYGMLICTITICIINIICTRHLCATQALAWVCMALSRGLACHVASVRVPHVKYPFFLFLINLSDFKIKINSDKF